LWAIIIVPMIISFIAYFSPASRSGGGLLGFMKGGQGAYGEINNQPVTEQEYNAARRDIAFQFLAQGRQLPDMDSVPLKQEVYRRLFYAAKEDQLGIHPTAEAAAQFAQQRFIGGAAYDEFVEKRLKPLGFTVDDFDHFLRSQVGTQQLQMLTSLNGRLVTPGEAESLFRSEHRALATKFVWFPASNFLHAVTVTPDILARYYTNELTSYSVPDRVQVDYVRYDAGNYTNAAMATLTNLDKDVDDLYARRGTNLVPEAKTPEEAKATARKDLILFTALKAARRDAFGFADELDRAGNHAGDLQKLAKDKGLTVRTTAPFDEETGPADVGLTNDFAAQFGKAAFELTDDAPFNHDITTSNAVYVMALKKKIPSYIPTFKEVEAKVTSDYRDAQAYQLAEQAATNFATTVAGELNVNNGVTLPKTFADICEETGNKAVSLPPFSLSTTNLPPELEGRVDLQALKRVGFTTAVGTVSTPYGVTGGSFVLFVEKMMPVDESLVKNGVIEYLALLRNARQNDAFNLWLDTQARQDSGLTHIFQELSQKTRETPASAPR
jgi:hypothetical protein